MRGPSLDARYATNETVGALARHSPETEEVDTREVYVSKPIPANAAHVLTSQADSMTVAALQVGLFSVLA